MRIVPTITIIDDMDKLRKILNRFSKYNIDTIRFVVSKEPLEKHIDFIRIAKQVYNEITGMNFKLMLDIPCPKDKLRFEFLDNEESVFLRKGEIINIVNSRDVQIYNDNKTFMVASNFKNRIPEIAIIGDGELLLKITTVSEQIITASCLNEAIIKNGKGIASQTGFLKTTDANITEKVLKIITALHPEICVLSYIENEKDIADFKMIINDFAGYIPHIAAFDDA